MAKTAEAPDADIVPKRNDAYTGFLAISFLAMVGATVLLYLEYQNYEGKTPPKTPPIDVPGVQIKVIPNSGNRPEPKKEPPPMPMEEPMPMMMKAPGLLPEAVTASAASAVQPVALIEIPELTAKQPPVEQPRAASISREPNIDDAPPLPTTRFTPPE
jgi:hypothetical protein